MNKKNRRIRDKWTKQEVNLGRKHAFTLASENTDIVTLSIKPTPRYVLANILLQEDEEEKEQRGWSCHEHAPHWEGLGHTEWVDEPASDIRVGGLDSFGHGELVRVCVLDQVVHQHHEDDGDGNTEVTKGTSHLQEGGKGRGEVSG